METARIGGIDFDVYRPGTKRAQDVGFLGAGSGVPLRAGAATGQQRKRIIITRRLWKRTGLLINKTRFAVGCKKPAVFEQAAFFTFGRSAPVPGRSNA